MTIIKTNTGYEATAYSRGAIITKRFAELEQAKQWLRGQYGIINLKVEVQNEN